MKAEPQRTYNRICAVVATAIFVAVLALLGSACDDDGGPSSSPTSDDQGGTNQGGSDQGGTNQGGSDQGGSDQGGSDQGGDQGDTGRPTSETTSTSVSRQHSCDSWRGAQAACNNWKGRGVATPEMGEDSSGTTSSFMTNQASQRSTFNQRKSDQMRKKLGIKPRDKLTRGQFAQMLCAGGGGRNCGNQEDAIKFMWDRELTTGRADGEYDPDSLLTNDQLVVFTDRLVEDLRSRTAWYAPTYIPPTQDRKNTDPPPRREVVVVPEVVVQPNVTVNEDVEAGHVEVTVALTGTTHYKTIVTLVTSDGTAKAGEDYKATTTTAEIAAGEQTTQVQVPIINDDEYEPDVETFTVAITGEPNWQGVYFRERTSGEVTIVSDDPEPLPIVTISGPDEEVTEHNQAYAVFTLSLSKPWDKAVEVAVATVDGTATAGEDYEEVDERISIHGTSKIVSVRILDDSIAEQDWTENFTLVISDPSEAELGDTTQAQATIKDDDALGVENLSMVCTTEDNKPKLDLTWDTVLAGNSNIYYETVIYLGEPVSSTSAVNASNAVAWEPSKIESWRTRYSFPRFGKDWSNTWRQLAWGETYTVSIRPRERSANRAETWSHSTVTCPPSTVVSFDKASATISEEGTTSTDVTVKLDNAPTSRVVIPLTVTHQNEASASDYSGMPSSVTFAAGETSKTFTVTATDDEDDDDGESIRLSFGSLPAKFNTGTPSTVTITITDNDTSYPPFLS